MGSITNSNDDYPSIGEALDILYDTIIRRDEGFDVEHPNMPEQNRLFLKQDLLKREIKQKQEVKRYLNGLALEVLSFAGDKNLSSEFHNWQVTEVSLYGFTAINLFVINDQGEKRVLKLYPNNPLKVSGSQETRPILDKQYFEKNKIEFAPIEAEVYAHGDFGNPTNILRYKPNQQFYIFQEQLIPYKEPGDKSQEKYFEKYNESLQAIEALNKNTNYNFFPQADFNFPERNWGWRKNKDGTVELLLFDPEGIQASKD